MRLGGSGNLIESFPARPKHMHYKTFMRFRKLEARLIRKIAAGIDDLMLSRRRISGSPFK
jgi:hypothetical protein